MNLLKGIRYDEEFVKNVPDDILDKLIHYDGVIPDEVAHPFYMNNPKFDEERRDFIDTHEYIRDQMYRARWERDQIEDDIERFSRDDDLNMSFIRNNPELIPMVKCIELFNADIPGQGVIETISFEEYVERFLD